MIRERLGQDRAAPLAVVGRKRSLADVPRNLDESAADHALRKA